MTIRVGAADERGVCVAIWLAALRARDGRDPGLEVAARAHAKFEQTTVRFAIAAGLSPHGYLAAGLTPVTWNCKSAVMLNMQSTMYVRVGWREFP